MIYIRNRTEKKNGRSKIKIKLNNLTNYLFVLPALIFIIGFVAYPIANNIYLSFHKVNMIVEVGGESFVGFKNYIEVLKMPVLITALFNTFKFSFFSVVFSFSIGFSLALFFYKRFPGNEFMRGILLVCWLIPALTRATIWQWIFAGRQGVINYILEKLYIIHEPILWLTTPLGAMTALIITNIWSSVPFNMLLLATGLTTLPVDVYEAAIIDGASRMQKFIRITIPLMRAVIISVFTLGVIYTFKTFDLVYIMTGGGPVDSTELLSTLSYKLTFDRFQFGTGAATANILFVILMLAGVVYLKFVSRNEVS